MTWLDAGIVFLLIAALGFCWKLGDRLRSLKGLTGAIAPNIARLASTLEKAAGAVGSLREVSDKSLDGIANCLPDARHLGEELGLLIEHADRLSYRLDDLIGKADAVEKELRRTMLVCAKAAENDKKEAAMALPRQRPVEKSDPRDLFIQRVVSRYPKENRDVPLEGIRENAAKWR